MSLTSSIELAFSGLRATQAGLDVVSQNVGNAGSVGYTRRVLTSEQQVSGGITAGVDVKGASRVLDTLVQRQLRLEQAGASYTGVKASAHAALDGLFDRPGGSGSLPTLLNGFTTRLQALANNPSSATVQSDALAAASDLAGSLNGLSDQVQALRQDSETAIGTAVKRADDLLQQIATLNSKVVANASSAALQDQRDALIDQLSTLVDLKVTTSGTGSVTIATTGGLQLFDGVRATRLSFDAHNLGPEAAYDVDPTRRGVGTITALSGDGTPRDVIASGLIRSGEIAAQIEIRDRVLTQAQAQLDELAAGLAASLSDKPVAGTATTVGGKAGFTIDLSPLQAGNTLSVTVTDAGGSPRTLTFVKATSAAGRAAATSEGRIGIDFSTGSASVASQIAAALGSGYTASSPAGSTLRILNNGAGNVVNAVAATASVAGLSTGSPELPLFVDAGRAGAVFTGSYEGGSQSVGFASRIAVNAAVKADPGALVAYGPGIPAGDTTRPLLILDRLTQTGRTFSGAANIGGSSSAFTGSVVEFAQQIVVTQAADASSAATLDDGQKVVLGAIQGRFSEQAGVNVDTELTQLIQLQTAYGANARLLTAAKDMMDLLLRVGA